MVYILLIDYDYSYLATREVAERLLGILSAKEQFAFIKDMLGLKNSYLSKEIEQFKNTQEGGQKTRQAILQLISEDGKISSTAMAQRLGINRSAVSKHLKAMKEAQLIRREDPDKGGKWVILGQNSTEEIKDDK